jgi:hypothetical protein
MHSPIDSNKQLIKRIIALPGDWVTHGDKSVLRHAPALRRLSLPSVSVSFLPVCLQWVAYGEGAARPLLGGGR